jgi:glycosyltransferase involved in cell wall biosynthesis
MSGEHLKSGLSGGKEQKYEVRDMKVCILHRYPISQAISTNPSLLDFLKILHSKNIKIKYLSYKEEECEKKINDIEIVELPFVLKRDRVLDKYIKSLLFILLTPYISYIIKKNQDIDLIYCDDSLFFYGYLLKKFTKLPVIIRLGDLQTGYLFLQKSKIHEFIFKILHFLEIRSWKKVDGLIPISKSFENYVKSKGIKDENIQMVPECVDVSRFSPHSRNKDIRKKYGVREEEILLLFHGVVEPLKGLDVLLEHFSQAIQDFPTVKLMIAGSGSSLEYLKRKAAKLGIAQHIIWAGWIPFSEITDYIAACDVGVPMRSSNFANNFVVTSALLQYWSREKPVLAPRLEAISDIVEDGKNGFLFSFEDPSEFKLKLGKLIEDAKLRENMGKHGRELVVREFDKQEVAKKLFNSVRYFLK